MAAEGEAPYVTKQWKTLILQDKWVFVFPRGMVLITCVIKMIGNGANISSCFSHRFRTSGFEAKYKKLTFPYAVEISSNPAGLTTPDILGIRAIHGP